MRVNGKWSDRHPVLAAVRTAVVSAVALAILGWLARKLIPEPTQDAIWSWLSIGVRRPRSIWLLLLAAAIAWPLFWTWALVRRYLHRAPPHERYRTDEFFGLRWRWRWYLFQALGMRAFCIECDTDSFRAA